MDSPDFYYGAPRTEILPLLPASPRRVLEVGCGSGAFRRNFAQDVEYWGIEPADGPAMEAEKHLSKVCRGTLTDSFAMLPDGYFDLIVCNDVIEHLTDHDWFLANIKTKMAPGAIMVGSVPNVRLLTNLYRLVVRRDWEYGDAGILDTTHLRFFTQKSWTRILATHGFLLERIIGLNSLGSTEKGLGGLAKSLVARASALILGSDVLYVQFGFRVKVAQQ
jgi:2-polyprenyl-3-methyl-5-hydroxy-6-metoxy-1,4-benzoquinol methylase